MRSLRGRLLVATPTLLDPNFHRTVVVLLEHGEPGALGVVLDRPTDTPVGDILPRWEDHALAPGAVFLGGPVQTDGMIGLARLVVDVDPDHDHDPPPGVQALWPGLATVDLEADPDSVAGFVSGLRAYVGYAGWSAGQLEGEIAEGAWFVVDATPGDLWTSRPRDLWRTVLRRQPGAVAQFAHAPDDPSVN